jgi:hypothetical protein
MIMSSIHPTQLRSLSYITRRKNPIVISLIQMDIRNPSNIRGVCEAILLYQKSIQFSGLHYYISA